MIEHDKLYNQHKYEEGGSLPPLHHLGDKSIPIIGTFSDKGSACEGIQWEIHYINGIRKYDDSVSRKDDS